MAAAAAAAAKLRLLPLTRPPPPPPRRHLLTGLRRPDSVSPVVRQGRGQKGGEGERAAAAKTRALLRLKRRTRSDVEFDRECYMRSLLANGQLGQGEEADGGHVPVMLAEVLQVFSRLRVHSFVDCTLGAAGHSAAIIRSHPELRLFVGLDVDTVALEKARAQISSLLSASSSGEGEEESRHLVKAYTYHRNFKYLKSVLGGIDESLLPADGGDGGGGGVEGILMDLGMSSMQVNNPERGFSVMCDGPLDMRMNTQATLKAEDILNSWPEAEVGRILREYGDECNWHLLQQKIVNARIVGGLHSTKDLVDLVRRASPRSGGRQGWIKTATRVFQSLRIAVNDELRTLEDALYACFDCLSSGGRLAVISFHSLEDRIVKQTFLDIIDRESTARNGEQLGGQRNHGCDNDEETWSKKRIRGVNGMILTKRPITPTEEEEKSNQRCRSAKLRVIEKV